MHSQGLYCISHGNVMLNQMCNTNLEHARPGTFTLSAMVMYCLIRCSNECRCDHSWV